MSKHRIIIIIFFSEDQNILKQEDDIRTQVMTLNTIVNMCNVFNFNNLFLDKGCVLCAHAYKIKTRYQ